ncbi:gliding motility-associated C-terminal domain-containing protein [Maribacter algicola]|uniref:Gliding motility-associated C-terminal domain-containing protein n=1 Tax=Meishania litoralis TaxID=3434685 RepID=A0ACC7LIT6_9FLAO
MSTPIRFNLAILLLLFLNFATVHSQITVSGNSGINTISAQTATVVAPNLTITSSGSITDFTVSITNSFTATDQLGYNGALPPGVTTSGWNSGERSIVFKGTLTALEWQTFLRNVTITSGPICSPETRQVSFVAEETFYNPLNEHFYRVTNTATSWTATKSTTSSTSYFGREGYLVTLTSNAENIFVTRIVGQNSWMGASDDHNQINEALGYDLYADTNASEGKFYWVTGPEKGTQITTANGNGNSVPGVFQNWRTGEPNDYNNGTPGESFGHVYSGAGDWNDFPDSSNIVGIMEFGGMPNDQTTSTPLFTKDIAINGAPGGNITGGDVSVCAGSNSTVLTLNGLDGSVVRWESSDNNFIDTPTTINNTTTSLTVTNISTTTYYRAVVNTNAPTNCANLITSSTPIYVLEANAGNVFAENTTICAGSDVELQVSGQNGDIEKWQRSTDNINWTDIANTSTTLNETIASTGTHYYRVVVGIAACGSSVASSSKEITVVSGTPPTGGQVSSAVHGSTTNSGTLTLSGHTGTVVKWQQSTDNGIIWDNIANTSTTYNYSNITTKTLFRAQLTSGSCGNTFSNEGSVSILDAPVITSFDPKLAGNGETVTITGTGFTGTTAVSFGSIAAKSFTIDSDTQISAVVDTGASGSISVSNPAGNDSETGFIFKVAQYDFEGDALDETENNHDGTVVNSLTYQTGAQGQAICFDNGPGYVELPNNLIRNLSEFTISLRFKTTSTGAILGYQNVAANTANTPTNWIPILMITNDGKLKGTLWTTTPAAIQAISTNPVNDGNWHQVDFTASSNTVTIYVDGVVEASTTGAAVNHLDMSFNQLGFAYTNNYNQSSTTWEYFSGCLDDMVIVDKALTSQELEDITALPEPTITNFTPTDGEEGDTIVITGNNFDGATQVTFGGTDAASYTVDSSTQITATVGTGATGAIAVTTAGGMATANGFTYIFQDPVFTSPTSAFAVGAAVFAQDLNIQPQLPNAYGITFNNDGTKMFVSGIFPSEIAEYILSTPFDIGTASYEDSLNGMSGRTTGITFNDDGTKILYVGYNGGNNVVEYVMSTPYDISTASLGQSVAFSETGSYADMTFNADGSKMFLLSTNSIIFEYNLSTNYDVSTASYTNTSHSISQSSNHMEIDFNNDGSKLFVISIGGELLEYDLSTPYDIASLTFVGIPFDTDGQEGNPYALAFDNNGGRFYVTGATGEVHQYNLQASIDFDENSTVAITDVDANDGDGGATDVGITFSLVSGSDNDLFAIDVNTGVLTFISAPDFESPQDDGSDNTYEVTVVATDDSGSSQLEIKVVVNDIPEFVLDQTALTIDEDGGTATFTVVMDAMPNGNIVLDVASSDTAEATAGPTPLTFTPANWNTPQTVTVTGINDDIYRDDTATISVTVDDVNTVGALEGLDEKTVAITLTNDDTAAYTVSETTLTMNENAGTDTFTVVLDSEPTNDVVFDVSSDDTNEATVSAAQLTFTSANWDTPQTVTVTGVDDDIDRGDSATITIAVNGAGSDDSFDALADQSVAITLTDDDTAAYTVSETALTIDENAGTDTFTVVLDTQPTSNVAFDISSDDNNEATVSAAQLTFTSANWDTPQTVTVTGVDDDIDRDDSVTITVSVNGAGSDDAFDALADKSVAITLTDDDTDSDGDSILDPVDNCVSIANADQLDTDSDGEGNVCDTDDDNDGTPDTDDDFPLDPAEDTDTDGDGTGDNADTDDDNDGTSDTDDDFPLDDSEDTDTDGDGTGDNADTDDDNDGTPDSEDDFPLDENEDTDTDGDGTGDNADTDDDNDGTPDSDDDFPLDDSEDTDTDGDGTGDNADTDDDNDGTPDSDDDFPLDDSEDTDTDGDGTGDNADTDDDNDGTPDSDDDFPLDDSEDTDTDGDGTGDNADTDDDNDGTPDSDDDFPLDDSEDTDTDGDGTGDNADTDDDNDGTPDTNDDFPLDDSEDTDTDGDGTGDNTDNDIDGDGIPNDEDTYPNGEITDADNDGVPDAEDAFPNDPNESVDSDGDGQGDNSDDDDDNDGIVDSEDAFPWDPTEDTDTDGDGTGDNADDDDDNDGTPDTQDAFPTDSSEDTDNDGDGVGDNADTDDDNDGVVDSEDDFPTHSEPAIVPAEAFTPNGDGVNDAWVVPGIENYLNNTVKVYNRWGHEVFATKGYGNDWEGFYNRNREKLPSGSYLYIIDLGNGSTPIQGWIFINY